jgi:hypothetical protein
MCKECHKNKQCTSACVSLMRVSRKDLTREELERVRTYEKYAKDDAQYGM